MITQKTNKKIPLKILCIDTSLCVGGASEYMLFLIKGIKNDSRYKERFEIDVCSAPGDIVQTLQKTEAIRKIFTLSCWSSFKWKEFKKLIRIIRAERYDIVHVYQTASGVLARLAARLASIKVKIIVTSPTAEDSHYWIKNSFKLFVHVHFFHPTWNYFFADRLIAVSQASKQALIKRERINPNKIEINYHGLDTHKYKVDNTVTENIKKEFGLSNNDFVVGTLSRLVEAKGIMYLLRAIPELAKGVDGLKVLLTGDGEDKQKFMNVVRELNISDKVIFPGWRNDSAGVLSVMDVFILPSLTEGFGISVLQAMAVGRAVVATEVGGIPDMINHEKNGILIPCKNPDAILNAVQYLYLNKEKRLELGVSARKTVQEKFSPKKSIGEVARLYKKITS